MTALGPDPLSRDFRFPEGLSCGWTEGWGASGPDEPQGPFSRVVKPPSPQDRRHHEDPAAPLRVAEAGGPKAPERGQGSVLCWGRGSRGLALATSIGRRPSAELPLQPLPLEA